VSRSILQIGTARGSLAAQTTATVLARVLLALAGTACAVGAEIDGPAAAPPAQVAALIRGLQDPNPLVRLKAAKALGQQGPAAAEAIPALTQALQDPDESLRLVAASALKKINQGRGEENTAVQQHIRALQDRDELVRLQAADALRQMGPAARAAVPALTEMARTETDEDVRLMVARALTAIRGDNQQVAPPADTPEDLRQAEQRRREEQIRDQRDRNRLVGTWQARFSIHGVEHTSTLHFRADETLTSTMVNQWGMVVFDKEGTYKLRGNSLVTNFPGEILMGKQQGTITWVNDNEIHYSRDAFKLVFRRIGQ